MGGFIKQNKQQKKKLVRSMDNGVEGIL